MFYEAWHEKNGQAHDDDGDPVSIIIVIPCYNEAQRLPISKLKAAADAGICERFVFVNDGSTDETSQILTRLHDSAPEKFSVCNLYRNVGKAEATRIGIRQAFEMRPNTIGYWDADLATPLEAISSFCEILDTKPEVEIVFGARVQLLGRTIERSALRHYFGRLFATAASLVLGLGVYDTQCGAKLFRASPEMQSVFAEPFLTRWLIDVEIIARLIQMRRRTALLGVENMIYELPLSEWRDVPGSKVRPQDFFKGLVGLGKIYWRYLR
jgi:dolichyl-phosphate beta-glucosyltransferase